MEKNYIVVLVTTVSKQEAENIVEKLLEKQLIACANITAVYSLFHWSGKTEKSEEYLIVMKSRKDLFENLSETVKALHSYEIPEIIAVPVVEGSEAYLGWLDSCLVEAEKG
ncbi:divalent-cation tolerance protein CutA [Candidatus Bathyarchaeota archaeon]|nr:divalent-cation tolerance protein CutA [Candidatus Bathyarchaeota archaeon]